MSPDSPSPGYPPPDHRVRDFLTHGDTDLEAYNRACAFLIALFNHTTATLEDHGLRGEDMITLASKFRALMTDGQKFHTPNAFRQKFSDRVVLDAAAILFPYVSSSSIHVL